MHCASNHEAFIAVCYIIVTDPESCAHKLIPVKNWDVRNALLELGMSLHHNKQIDNASLFVNKKESQVKGL